MTSAAPTQELVATYDSLAGLDELEKIWQKGSCHCGAVKYEVLHEPLYQIPDKPAQMFVIRCNCTICTTNGYLFIYPERHELKWISGWEEMKTYMFNTKTREHRFCGICGSSVCIDFKGSRKEGDLIGINARLIEDIDIDKLKLRKKNHRNKDL